ncbi:hypothetical protein M7I_7969 [Glarea lozoyensis 74030]|uniref:Uncharacterized protein n=1 Tax=Glarea lozoyensis (strain ATCC 74030 / MF5533) TaxID=1104152 RepID=H0EYR1_GLAL7|nr:hypothetical protein M7I_7969 [Glarea lozoyensis 74030]
MARSTYKILQLMQTTKCVVRIAGGKPIRITLQAKAAPRHSKKIRTRAKFDLVEFIESSCGKTEIEHVKPVAPLQLFVHRSLRPFAMCQGNFLSVFQSRVNAIEKVENDVFDSSEGQS